VQELEQLITDPELGNEAMEVIRAMIAGVTVTPRSNGDGIGLSGDLAQILSICRGVKKRNARAISGAGRLDDFDYDVSVVAGIGFEPMTFRL
jgi:site-specific DNA recombinase